MYIHIIDSTSFHYLIQRHGNPFARIDSRIFIISLAKKANFLIIHAFPYTYLNYLTQLQVNNYSLSQLIHSQVFVSVQNFKLSIKIWLYSLHINTSNEYIPVNVIK
jgi:hypothetical protein